MSPYSVSGGGFLSPDLVKRLYLWLDSMFSSIATVFLQLLTVVDAIELYGRIAWIGLEALIVSIETDRHHVWFLFHQFDALRKAPIGDAILDDGLGNRKGEKVVQFSKRFKEDITRWSSKGFRIENASVNFIVYWKDEEKNIEVKILLPEIFLKKTN